MRTLLWAALCSLSTALVLAQSTDYVIKMHRPASAGQTYLFVASATGDQTAETIVDGNAGPAQTQSRTVALTAHATTLAVNTVGKETKISLVLDQSKCTMDGITSEILPAKTAVVADRNMTPHYSVNGTAVGARADKCLQQVLPFGPTTDVTDDQVFGTSARQKVGASWPINGALAAKHIFSDADLKVDGKNVSGTTKLAEIVTLADRPAMRLLGELTLTGVAIPLPPGLTINSSEFHATITGVIPIDVSRRDGTLGMTMSGHVECSGDANGHTLKLRLTMTQHLENSITIQSSGY